jgi:hypothetical protein
MIMILIMMIIMMMMEEMNMHKYMTNCVYLFLLLADFEMESTGK